MGISNSGSMNKGKSFGRRLPFVNTSKMIRQAEMLIRQLALTKNNGIDRLKKEGSENRLL